MDSEWKVSKLQSQDFDTKLMVGDFAIITKKKPRDCETLMVEALTDSDAYSIEFNPGVELAPQANFPLKLAKKVVMTVQLAPSQIHYCRKTQRSAVRVPSLGMMMTGFQPQRVPYVPLQKLLGAPSAIQDCPSSLAQLTAKVYKNLATSHGARVTRACQVKILHQVLMDASHAHRDVSHRVDYLVITAVSRTW